MFQKGFGKGMNNIKLKTSCCWKLKKKLKFSFLCDQIIASNRGTSLSRSIQNNIIEYKFGRKNTPVLMKKRILVIMFSRSHAKIRQGAKKHYFSGIHFRWLHPEDKISDNFDFVKKANNFWKMEYFARLFSFWVHARHVCQRQQKHVISKTETFFKNCNWGHDVFEITVQNEQKLQNVKTIKDDLFLKKLLWCIFPSESIIL